MHEMATFFDTFTSEGNGDWFLPSSIALLQKAMAIGSFLLR
jgi:hypothetical protein